MVGLEGVLDSTCAVTPDFNGILDSWMEYDANLAVLENSFGKIAVLNAVDFFRVLMRLVNTRRTVSDVIVIVEWLDD